MMIIKLNSTNNSTLEIGGYITYCHSLYCARIKTINIFPEVSLTFYLKSSKHLTLSRVKAQISERILSEKCLEVKQNLLSFTQRRRNTAVMVNIDPCVSSQHLKLTQ